MLLSLKNKKIIISAGASGIGWATAKICLSKGAYVYLCDIDNKSLNKIKKHPLANKKLFYYECDASDEDDVSNFFSQVNRKTKKVDALINNVGVAGPTGTIEKLTSEDWEQTLKINVISHFYFTKLAIPMLKKNKGKKIDEELIGTLRMAMKEIENGCLLNAINLNSNQFKILEDYNFLTLKPFIYVCNVDELSIKSGNSLSLLVDDYAIKKKSKSLRISAQIESEISLIENESEKSEFLHSMGLRETSLSVLIREGYSLLNLITFFTSGPKESRAWSIKNNTLAPDAAAKIHTDFKKGFIRAEVISYKDFINFNGEANCKEKGKLRLEGKDYLVNDGDIMLFRVGS